MSPFHSGLLDRRTALKLGGAAIGTAAIGGGGLLALSGSGVAVEEFTVNGDDSTFELNDGQVTAVVVDAQGQITWDGLDHDAEKATVTLEAENPDDTYVQVAQTTLDLAGNQRKSGSATFDYAPVDLTTLSGFDDAHFSADTDGETVDRTVTLRITVDVTTSDPDYAVSDERTASMNTSVLNEDATAGQDAEADTYDAYAGPIYDKNDQQTGEEAYLYAQYGTEAIILQMDLRNWLDDVADDNPYRNAAIGVDADEDNIGDYQFGWLPSDDVAAGMTFGVKEGSADGWGDWSKATDHAAVNSASMTDDIVQFELDRSELGIATDETYLTGYFASAGGEAPYVAVSAEPGEFWSSANNYTSSEYWLQLRAE